MEKLEKTCWIHVDWFFTDRYDFDYWLKNTQGGCNSTYYIEVTRYQFDTIRSFKPYQTNSRDTNESLIETLKNLFDKYTLTINKEQTEDKILHLDEYQQQALRTVPTREFDKNLMNGVLGLCGESGEVADLVKKATFQGHSLDEVKLIEELGDTLFYLSLTAYTLGYSLSEVATINIEKLKKRYPNGFDPNRSKNRKCEGEQE